MCETFGTEFTDWTRILASAWIKRLIEDKALSEKLKINYIKLLIYFLQKQKLDGPFSEHPSSFETLADFPKDQNLFETFQTSTKKRPKSLQPYTSDFDGDLRTYVAYQDIDNFGVHCYYALSQYPITTWYKFDENLFPTGISPGGVVPSQPIQEKKDEELEKKKIDFAEKLQKKVKNDNKKVMFLVSPIGKKDKYEDDREPPTWGSNLIQVKDIDEN